MQVTVACFRGTPREHALRAQGRRRHSGACPSPAIPNTQAHSLVQRDPIGLLGGMNVYAYSDGTPTIKIDPEGKAGRSIPEQISEIERRLIEKIEELASKPDCNGRIRAQLHRLQNLRNNLYGRLRPPNPLFLCILSATAGAAAGTCINNAFGDSNEGFRISDGLADALVNWWNPEESWADFYH